jgi:rSAM/selenodomain-associated transferase 2
VHLAHRRIPAISVVIPAINEQPNVSRAIASAYDACADEVIVVDGGSSDHTMDVARQSGATVISSPPGRAIQQNAGAQAASGDMLLFLHADCRLHSDAIRQVRDAFQQRRLVCAAFRQRIESDAWIYRVVERGNAARVAWLGWPYGDQGICLPKELFGKIGGFPPVMLMEDLLLLKKLRTYGRPVLLPGPIYVSDRRWARQGLVRQTVRNWTLLAAYRCGVSPDRLAHHYRRHDH